MVSVLVAVACIGALVGDASSLGARRGSTRGLIIFGYPYAARCPAGGGQQVVDRWGMYICNCTSYVAWALHANHQRTDWFIRGAMDAWNWTNVARRRGLRVQWRPTVRAVAVWPKLARPFGHIAYVTRVEPDGRFDVSEYNLPTKADPHSFRFDTRSNVSARGATFIEVPERR